MKFKVWDKVRLTRELIYIKIKQGSPLDDLDINWFIITKIENGTIYREDNKRYGQWELELVPEEPEFEYGEEIEVSDDGEEWEKRIYLATVGVDRKLHICVSRALVERYKSWLTYNAYTWEYARKLRPQLTRKEIAEKFWVSGDFILID